MISAQSSRAAAPSGSPSGSAMPSGVTVVGSCRGRTSTQSSVPSARLSGTMTSMPRDISPAISGPVPGSVAIDT